MNYRIRYNHTGPQSASSKREAVSLVRSESRSRLRHVECTDGLYLYTSTEDMRRDDTGARAYAVVSPAEQDGEDRL